MHEVRTKPTIRLNLSFWPRHVKPGLQALFKYKESRFSSAIASGFFEEFPGADTHPLGTPQLSDRE
jgi:hypothetical protein